MLSIEEHFREQIEVYNRTVFDNGLENHVLQKSIFEVPRIGHDYDLVYLDPPYVPRADDNCYIKRYHFLEGLSCYWQGQEILAHSKVRKIRKKCTPFSYRSDALSAFEQMFLSFRRSTLVLSYSSSGFPDLYCLVTLMKKVKKAVKVYEKDHRYHFGTHAAVKRRPLMRSVPLSAPLKPIGKIPSQSELSNSLSPFGSAPSTPGKIFSKCLTWTLTVQ